MKMYIFEGKLLLGRMSGLDVHHWKIGAQEEASSRFGRASK